MQETDVSNIKLNTPTQRLSRPCSLKSPPASYFLLLEGDPLPQLGEDFLYSLVKVLQLLWEKS